MEELHLEDLEELVEGLADQYGANGKGVKAVGNRRRAEGHKDGGADV